MTSLSSLPDAEGRPAEALVRRLVAGAQDAIVVLDESMRVTSWNAAAERIFGRSSAEMIGKDLLAALVPDAALDLVREEYSRLLRTDGDTARGRTFEVTARRPDGRELPVEMSVSAARLDGAWHVLGIARDLSERQRAQERLERSDRLRKLALEIGQEPASPLPGEVATRFGIQSQLAMAIFPRGRPPWMVVVHQCSHPRVWSPEDVRLFEAIGHRLGDSLTNLLAFRELRESELRLRTLVATIPDLVWLKDPQGVYLSCNLLRPRVSLDI